MKRELAESQSDGEFLFFPKREDGNIYAYLVDAPVLGLPPSPLPFLSRCITCQARFDEVVTKLSPFLKSCGYNVKRDVIFLPISGFTGENIRDPVSPERCPWWAGQPTLFQILDNMDPIDRDPLAPFRMPVMDKYREMGICVMGKIEAGTVKRGDALMLMPNKKEVKVQNILLETEEKNTAKVGENVRLRILGKRECSARDRGRGGCFKFIVCMCVRFRVRLAITLMIVMMTTMVE